MTFVEAVSSVFSNYANFSGRARRSEYWFFQLFNIIVTAIIGVIARSTGANFIATIWQIAILIPSWALVWRRMHDIGKSGAWALLEFVPIVGWIFILVWVCTDSEPGANNYGPSPKAVY